MFASEIVLGSFAVESLTPIVIASVIAHVAHVRATEAGWGRPFGELHYEYLGAWDQMPSYMVLGLLCGLAAVGFSKLLYGIEDLTERRVPVWWQRALLLGTLVGAIAVGYELVMPRVAPLPNREVHAPVLFGVGYEFVERSLHLQNESKPVSPTKPRRQWWQFAPESPDAWANLALDPQRMRTELLWLVPLILLKPLLTSFTLAGGGSGGIFAPSLFLGAAWEDRLA